MTSSQSALASPNSGQETSPRTEAWTLHQGEARGFGLQSARVQGFSPYLHHHVINRLLLEEELNLRHPKALRLKPAPTAEALEKPIWAHSVEI